MTTQEKNDNIKNAALAIVGIILIVWALFVHLPNEEKKKQKKVNATLLESCLSQAEDNYFENWNSSCKKIGKKDDCLLYSNSAKAVESWRKEDEQKCFKKYNK